MGFQYPKRYGSSSLYIWFAHFTANFIQAMLRPGCTPLCQFVVLTDGESDDSPLLSRTRTFHSQIFFSGSTTTGSSYVTRGSAVEFRLVFGLFVPDEGFPKHREDLVVGDRCRHPQFRLEPEPVSVGSQNAELVSISFAHLVPVQVLWGPRRQMPVNQFHSVPTLASMELRVYYDRPVNEFRLVSLRNNGIPTLLRQGSLPIPERISFATFRGLSILRLLTVCGYHIRSRFSSLHILSTTVSSYRRVEVGFVQWSTGAGLTGSGRHW